MVSGYYCLLPAVAEVAVVNEEVVTGTLTKERREEKSTYCDRRGSVELLKCPGVGSVPDIQVSGEETHELIGRITGVFIL